MSVGKSWNGPELERAEILGALDERPRCSTNAASQPQPLRGRGAAVAIAYDAQRVTKDVDVDAIQLASALAVSEDLTAFVAYDRRLRSAASDAGLEIAAPQ